MTSVRRLGRRPRLVRVGVLVVVLAVATAACSVEQALAPPGCGGGSGLIAAQSVPTAQLIPCFEDLPDGWSFASVAINQSGTVVRLDSDRAGDDAATFRFEEACDVADGVSRPHQRQDVEQTESIERLQPFRARIYLRFDGGCATWMFDFDGGAPATESVAVEEVLEFWTRSELNDNIRDTFIDEEL